MKELFPKLAAPETMMVKCDCKTRFKGKRMVRRPDYEQLSVQLQRGVDPTFFVGTCGGCGKIHTVKEGS